LRVRGARRAYKMGHEYVNVLKGVDLTVRRGEFLAIEGRSGSGKSTLLHVLGALETLDDGTVEFEGVPYGQRTRGSRATRIEVLLVQLAEWWADFLFVWKVLGVLALTAAAFPFLRRVPGVHTHSWPSFIGWLGACALAASILAMLPGLMLWLLKLLVRASLWTARILFSFALRPGETTHELVESMHIMRRAADLRNRQFGFVFQFYYLLPELNVLENALLPIMVERGCVNYFTSKREITQRAVAVLQSLDMAHRLKHRPNQLSGGERQRVAIARALMNQPRVLFADEPTGNLDAETGKQIMGVLEKLHRENGQTIIMVTHDRSLARQADRVLVLKDGKLERAES
jgi:ABC-type lipoprotein export system ATPase subunit